MRVSGKAVPLIMLLVVILSGCSRVEPVDDERNSLLDSFNSSVIWAYRSAEGSITAWNHGPDAIAVQISPTSDPKWSLVSLESISGTVASTKQVDASTALYGPVGLVGQLDGGSLVLYDENLRQQTIGHAYLPDVSQPLDVVSLNGHHYVLHREAGMNHVRCIDANGNAVWQTDISVSDGGTEAAMMPSRIESMNETTILVYGSGVAGLTAISLKDGALLWSYIPGSGLEKRVSSVSVGDSGILVTAIVNSASHCGEVSLLSTTGEAVWTVETEHPALVARVLTDGEAETYWCLSGVGEGIGPRGGNTLFQVFPDGSLVEVLPKVAYDGPSSLTPGSAGLLMCGHEDGMIHIVTPGKEPRSIRYAEQGLYRRASLIGASGNSVVIGLSSGDSSNLTIVACVALPKD